MTEIEKYEWYIFFLLNDRIMAYFGYNSVILAIYLTGSYRIKKYVAEI